MVPPIAAGEVSCRVRTIGARPPAGGFTPRRACCAPVLGPPPPSHSGVGVRAGGRGWADQSLVPGHRWPGHSGTVGRAVRYVCPNRTVPRRGVGVSPTGRAPEQLGAAGRTPCVADLAYRIRANRPCCVRDPTLERPRSGYGPEHHEVSGGT